VHHLDEITNVEDAVLLALAADEILLEPLRTIACLKIEKMVTVENVWHTFNSTYLVPKVAAACTKVLNIGYFNLVFKLFLQYYYSFFLLKQPNVLKTLHSWKPPRTA